MPFTPAVVLQDRTDLFAKLRFGLEFVAVHFRFDELHDTEPNRIGPDSKVTGVLPRVDLAKVRFGRVALRVIEVVAVQIGAEFVLPELRLCVFHRCC